jgi:hypothetical protein
MKRPKALDEGQKVVPLRAVEDDEGKEATA